MSSASEYYARQKADSDAMSARSDKWYSDFMNRPTPTYTYSLPGVEDKEDAELAGTQAYTDYLKKKTDLLGKPETTTTSWSATMAKPEMADLPEFNAPEYGEVPKFGEVQMEDIPEFSAPEYDDQRVSALQQKAAAPGLRNLRTATQAAMKQKSDNPNVTAMTMRQALQGYGQGLDSVMSGAYNTARGQYDTEYGTAYEAAKTNYAAELQGIRDRYKGKMDTRSAEYAAEVNALNQKFAGALEAEKAQYNVESQKVFTLYESAMDAYIRTGTTTSKKTYG